MDISKTTILQELSSLCYKIKLVDPLMLMKLLMVILFLLVSFSSSACIISPAKRIAMNTEQFIESSDLESSNNLNNMEQNPLTAPVGSPSLFLERGGSA